MRERLILAAILAMLCLAGRPSVAEQAPVLVVETGVHEAAINAMAPLADGSGFVTVSDDKTARIWSPDGTRALGVLLPPIGPGDDGALYAVAAAPKVIAVGGRIRAAKGGFGVAFFSTADQRPLAVISGLPGAVMALRISAAGDRMAVGMDTGGLQVFDLKSQTLVLEDTDFSGPITGLDFNAAGVLAVAAGGDSVGLYDPSLHKLPPARLPRGARAQGIVFGPGGGVLAVGDRGRAVVHLIDPATGRLLRDLDGAAGRNGSFNVAAFSADGTTVFAAGSYIDNAGMLNIRRWPVAGGAGTDIPAARDLITSLMASGPAMMFATAEPRMGVVDAGNQARAVETPVHIDFHDRARTAIRLSPNGAAIEIANGAGRTLVFDAAAREFLPPGNATRDFTSPEAKGFGLTVTGWRDGHTPAVNGRSLTMEPAETARSAAVSPSGAVIGTDFHLHHADTSNRVWTIPVPSPVWAVHTSADGRVVVACLGDGTIRWYDAADGHALASAFIDPVGRRVVVWTEEGYFDHDHRTDGLPDGRELIGYRVNQDNGRASDFIAIGQLYPTWFRPDRVGLAFRGGEAPRREPAPQTSARETLRQGKPPKVTVIDACAVESAAVSGCGDSRSIAFRGTADGSPAKVTAPVLLLRYKVEDSGGPPGQVVPRLNGAAVNGRIAVESTDGRTRIEKATFTLASGLNIIGLTAANATGTIEAPIGSAPEIRLLRTTGPAPVTAEAAPGGGAPDRPVETTPTAHLFALTVGAGKLANPDWNLANPANDADALASVLKQDKARLFAGVDARALVDATATKANIVAALRDISGRAGPDDVVVVFLAGHGRTVDGKYYFAPSDMGRADPTLFAAVKAAKTEAEHDIATDAVFRAEGLGQDELLPLLRDIGASRIAFILDTCYSATVADADSVLRRDLNTTITNRIGHASGRFVLSGSLTEAFDSAAGADAAAAEEGHGLFTAYLLRALNGEAGTDDLGRVDIYKLATFTSERVIAASRRILERNAARPGEKAPDIQRPAYYFSGNDFFALRKLPGR